MKIGIPKAFFYWKRPLFWETFFSSLGVETVLSPSTNKEIVEAGAKIADPETCFSVKVYWGHLLWLEGKCDYIFVPRMKTNHEKEEYCPKFFGIPDVAKILVKTPLITETFDEKKEPFKRTAEKIARRFCDNVYEIERAFKKALDEEKKLLEKRKESFRQKISSDKKKIFLISHPYNLYDEYANLKIEEKLKSLGVETIFVDEIQEIKNESYSNLGFESPDIHWEFGREMLSRVNEILKHDLAGVIEISSFQCGCDAVIKEFVEKAFKDRKIPFLYLIIDEQTGEAGYQTRLEAFVDTLK